MNLAELQAVLRHFAAERDWQPFHTPKNLSTALMVEAAELAEIFQWMTPEASQQAHQDAGVKLRIGEEVADVLLYLLQLADHSQIDLAQAVTSKLAGNALKYPAKRAIAQVSPLRASAAGTHVLLDYENVQPTEDELRALVPDASQVWVFHGPHQRQVEARFASFGGNVTPVPISQTGKNALDFHLAFYMGYIASRNQASAMVVVANDKGYEPMLAHARAMGFDVRQLGHARARPAAVATVLPSAQAAQGKAPAKKAPAKQAPAKRAPAKQAATKKTVAKKASAKAAVGAAVVAKKVPAKTVPAKQAAPVRKAVATVTRKAGSLAPPVAAKPQALAGSRAQVAALSPESAATVLKLTDSLRKMGVKRPIKPASLRRALKSFLGAGATDQAVEQALAGLVAASVVQVDAVKGASYPRFDLQSGSARSRS